MDSTFAGCRIDAVAARGGMGVVYRATELELGRTVALKLVAPERAANRTFQERFKRESRVAASIDHPNVLPLYGAGEDHGLLYLVMRWVEGTDLQELIAAKGKLDPLHAVEIVAQVGAGLDAAHSAGLVHRDVKPANVLIDGHSEHVYLSDFGLSLEAKADPRLTETGEWLGTVDFMAPEQFRDDEVDARTDIYALGCVLYMALTGRPPFHRGTIAATMLAHLRDPAPRPSATADAPTALDAVVARALAKRPADRYPSANAMASDALAAVGRPDWVPGGAKGAKGIRSARAEGASDSAPTVVRPDTTLALENGARAPDPARRPTARIARARPRLARPALIATGVAVAAGAAMTLIAVEQLATDGRTGPLSESEVRGAVDAFADAYAREDGGDLGRVLARDVARVTPGDSQRGRGVVVREYRRQFAAQATEGYVLRGLDVRAGAIGRASGRYVVSRSRDEPITGRVVFGVERDRGRPRIGLIAATPEA